MISSRLWIVLSTTWALEDVQAVLTVLIALVATITAWAVTQTCWKRSFNRVSQYRTVSLLSLLTVSTISEAFDIVFLLGFKLILRPRHWRILVQCLVIFTLTVLGILSGPLARLSTRRGTIEQQQQVSGYLATDDHQSISGALVKWNTTIHRFQEAEVPPNQLLDFLPDSSTPWLYRKGEWNSSWSMNCDFTPRAVVENVSTTANYTGGFFDEVPSLRSTFRPPDFNPSLFKAAWDKAGFFDARGSGSSKVTYWKDLVVFILAAITETNDTDVRIEPRRFITAAYHFQNVSSGPDSLDVDALFAAETTIPKVFYTKADCTVLPDPSLPADHIGDPMRAYPWTPMIGSIVVGLNLYHTTAIVEASIQNRTIPLPEGPDMARFLQAYMVTKDTQYLRPAQRALTAVAGTVEVNIVIVAMLALLLVLVLLVAIRYGVLPEGLLRWSTKRHEQEVPKGKVDWLVHALRENQTQPAECVHVEHDKTSTFVSTTTSIDVKPDVETANFGHLDVASNRIGIM